MVLVSYIFWVLTTCGSVFHACEGIQHIIACRRCSLNLQFSESEKKWIKQKLKGQIERNNKWRAEVVHDCCLRHFVNNTKLKE